MADNNEKEVGNNADTAVNNADADSNTEKQEKKKSTGAKNSGKGTASKSTSNKGTSNKSTSGKGTSKGASKKSNSGNKNTKKKPKTREEQRLTNEIKGIIYLGVAALLLLFAFASSSMGYAGVAYQYVILHNFGFCSAAIPFALGYYGIITLQNKDVRFLKFKLTVLICLILSVCCTIHAVRVTTQTAKLTYLQHILYYYLNGDLSNGGFLGAVIGGAFVKLFTIKGKIVVFFIFVLIDIILLIMLSGKSVMDVVNRIKQFILGISEEASLALSYGDDEDYDPPKMQAKKNFEKYDEYEDSDDYDEEYDDEEERNVSKSSFISELGNKLQNGSLLDALKNKFFSENNSSYDENEDFDNSEDIENTDGDESENNGVKNNEEERIKFVPNYENVRRKTEDLARIQREALKKDAKNASKSDSENGKKATGTEKKKKKRLEALSEVNKREQDYQDMVNSLGVPTFSIKDEDDYYKEEAVKLDTDFINKNNRIYNPNITRDFGSMPSLRETLRAAELKVRQENEGEKVSDLFNGYDRNEETAAMKNDFNDNMVGNPVSNDETEKSPVKFAENVKVAGGEKSFESGKTHTFEQSKAENTNAVHTEEKHNVSSSGNAFDNSSNRGYAGSSGDSLNGGYTASSADNSANAGYNISSYNDSNTETTGEESGYVKNPMGVYVRATHKHIEENNLQGYSTKAADSEPRNYPEESKSSNAERYGYNDGYGDTYNDNYNVDNHTEHGDFENGSFQNRYAENESHFENSSHSDTNKDFSKKDEFIPVNENAEVPITYNQPKEMPVYGKSLRDIMSDTSTAEDRKKKAVRIDIGDEVPYSDYEGANSNADIIKHAGDMPVHYDTVPTHSKEMPKNYSNESNHADIHNKYDSESNQHSRYEGENNHSDFAHNGYDNMPKQAVTEIQIPREDIRKPNYGNSDDPVIIEAEKVKTVDILMTDEENTDNYEFPKIEFLSTNPKVYSMSSKQEIIEKAKKLEATLATFGIDAKVNNISQGPAVTRYEITPPQGVRVNKIVSLEDDIMLSLAAKSVRIEAPIPGKSAIGIEIPNDEVTPVYFSEILKTDKFQEFESKLAFGIGKDIAGNVIIADISKMPHLLIAGATGSGKSVCINTLITSILYKATPSEVRLIMVDPKVVELSVYNDIPHLLVPVVTDVHKAAGALRWACAEMDRRYMLFAQTGTRNLAGYNNLMPKSSKLPHIVIIIDELADLMLSAKKEVEAYIQRLTQLARAAGMHLIVATQRPSVDVITGVIKSNIPSRIAFKVASAVDSKTILDGSGADKLLGMGDMIMKAAGVKGVDINTPLRIQGAFVKDDEVERIVNFIKVEDGNYDESVIGEIEKAATANDGDDDDSSDSGSSNGDELTDEVIEFLVKKGKASIGLVQRRFRIGYNRAARIIEDLEERGIVGPDNGTKGRAVYMDKAELFDRKNRYEDL